MKGAGAVRTKGYPAPFIYMNDNELLKYAVEHGMIDTSYVQEQIEMKKREELLSKHPYKIWQGNDGKWYTYLPNDNGRKMIKRNKKENVEEQVVLYWKNEDENPTLKELFYEWINRKIEYHDICRGTYDRYEKDFNRFFEKDSDFSMRKIKNIEAKEIIPFLRKAIAKYSLTSKAYSNLRTLVYGIFKYAKEEEYISWSISHIVGDMELSQRSFRKVIKEDDEEVFNDDEISKLIKEISLNPDMLNLGIVLMFCTGIRVGELVALKWCDVTDNSIKIRRTEISYKGDNKKYVYEIREYPKTEASIRTVYVPSEFSSILKRLRLMSDNKEYMFWKNGKNIKVLQVRKRLYILCDRLGIRRKSPHKLRKTYVSILLDNGVDKRLVQDVAGHTQISTSERNYHRNRKTDAKKEEILSNIPEFKNAKVMF